VPINAAMVVIMMDVSGLWRPIDRLFRRYRDSDSLPFDAKSIIMMAFFLTNAIQHDSGDKQGVSDMSTV